MEHYAKFLNDAGFNSGINPKDKMQIVASDAGFHMKHQTELQHHAEVYLNNPES